MKIRHSAMAVAAIVTIGCSTMAADVTSDRIAKADSEPGNWLTYHGNYQSWHYSGLSEINTGNVKNLKEAWSHVASRSVRGLQSYPLAVDGLLYYSGSYTQVWAIAGATAEVR